MLTNTPTAGQPCTRSPDLVWMSPKGLSLKQNLTEAQAQQIFLLPSDIKLIQIDKWRHHHAHRVLLIFSVCTAHYEKCLKWNCCSLSSSCFLVFAFQLTSSTFCSGVWIALLLLSCMPVSATGIQSVSQSVGQPVSQSVSRPLTRPLGRSLQSGVCLVVQLCCSFEPPYDALQCTYLFCCGKKITLNKLLLALQASELVLGHKLVF